MPRVHIPPLLRNLTGGVEFVDIPGKTVRQVIDGLESRFPGVRERLCEGDAIKPGLAVAVDGNIGSRGLSQKVEAKSEVHFLPAVGGG